MIIWKKVYDWLKEEGGNELLSHHQVCPKTVRYTCRLQISVKFSYIVSKVYTSKRVVSNRYQENNL